MLQRRLGQTRFQPDGIEPSINPHEQEARRLGDSGQVPLRHAAAPSWEFSKVSIFPPNQQPSSAPLRLQAKLAIRAANDPLEHEADRIADQVMRMPDPSLSLSPTPAQIFRKCAACEEEALQMKPAALAGPAAREAPLIVHEVLRGPGQPLDAATRAFMEPRFGQDFSRVRIHSDCQAAESTQAVNALAYTVGRDIAFGAGQYTPYASAGRHLLAHELAHVVQQRGNTGPVQQDRKLGKENDRHEQGAERSAAHLVNSAQVQGCSIISSPLMQRTKICSKRLEAPVLGWRFNHSYIDDTGMDNCLGSSMPGNYAIQALVSGNFVKGCAVKTATSSDPMGRTPNVKQCDPAPGVANLSKCLFDAYSAYSDPSVYKNPFGPNSNTFAATLAKTCCADGSSKGLGWVPGWNHDPAPTCPSTKVLVAAAEREEFRPSGWVGGGGEFAGGGASGFF